MANNIYKKYKPSIYIRNVATSCKSGREWERRHSAAMSALLDHGPQDSHIVSISKPVGHNLASLAYG